MKIFSSPISYLILAAFSVALSNTAKATETDLYSFLNDSPNKSPNVTWSAEGDTALEVGDETLNYTWTNTDTSRDKYTYRPTSLSGDVTADFIGVQSGVSSGWSNHPGGGAIFMGSVYNSYTYTYTHYSPNLTSITGNFIGNRAYQSGSSWIWLLGGAINHWFEETDGSLTNITGDFVGNSVTGDSASVEGGAIYIVGGKNVTIHGNFIGNRAVSHSSAEGGAISGQGSLKEIVGSFIGNYAYSESSDVEGGAIHAQFKTDGGINALSGDFIDNYAYALEDDEYARGGAIYNEYNESEYENRIALVADGSNSADNIYQQDVLFKGNYVQVGEDGEKKYEAIYNSGTLEFNARNGGSFTFYDYINSRSMDSKLNFTGDGTGVFNLYNNIVGGSTISIINSYVINMINNEINHISGTSLSVEDASKLNIDVDLATGESDTIKVAKVEGAENFSLNEINLLADMPENAEGLRIQYADKPVTGNLFKREQSTSNATYQIANDGQYILVSKTAKPGGYASFLADINNQGRERSYSFTKDEIVGHILDSGKDSTGTLEGKEAEITIFGNNHSLNNTDGEIIAAMQLSDNQSAEINDLTVSGFENGLFNAGGGIFTLNNVNFADNQTALRNTDNVLFKGENTVSGGENALFMDAFKGNKYPLFSIYLDYTIWEMLGEAGVESYEDIKELWPSFIAAEGELEEIVRMYNIQTNDIDMYDISYTPALYARIMAAQFGLPPTAETSEFDIVSTVLHNGQVEIDEEDYGRFLNTLESVAQEHGPYTAVMMLMQAVSGKIYYSFDEFIDASLLKELRYSYTEEQIAQFSEEEMANFKKTFMERYDASRERVDSIYEQYNIPNPAEKFAIVKPEATLSFAEDAVLNLNSKIDGETVYGLTFDGAQNAVINLNSTIEKADLVLDGPVLKLQDEGNLAALNSFEAISGTLDTQNGTIGTLVLPNFTVSGEIDLYVDADLANKQMDQIKVVQTVADEPKDNAGLRMVADDITPTSDDNDEGEEAATGIINLAGIQLLSDAEEASTTVELFADEASKEALKDQVTGEIEGISYSPIYKYNAEYNAEDGTVTFARFDAEPDEPEEQEPAAPEPTPVIPEPVPTPKPVVPDEPKPERRRATPRDFNPSLYAASVSNIVTGFVQSAISNAVFVNTLSQNGSSGLASGDMPKFGNAWISLLTFNDDVDIKHFETVDSRLMSVVGGVNSDKVSLGYGKALWGVYAGYLNGRQKFNLNKIEQNGGFAGVNAGYEQNNFVAAATANVGFIDNEDKNNFGKDKFNTYWTGVSLKSGYNLALGYGFVLQPNVKLGYTYVNTETYTTEAGVRMKNDALNLWETALGAELSKSFGKTWRGYTHGKYAFVGHSGGDVQANNIILPHVSNKSYAEYGLGLEKALTDSWKLAAEVNRRDGGREGWDVRFDVRYDF